MLENRLLTNNLKIVRIVFETPLILHGAIFLVFLMKVGMLLPQTGELATSENVLHIGKEAEKEGLDSVWVFERLLWPVKPQTPYGGVPDLPIPTEYQSVLDPLETLTYLAGNTERISLGTSIIDMLFQNPVILARRFATLDIFSGGGLLQVLQLDGQKMSMMLRAYLTDRKEQGQTNICK